MGECLNSLAETGVAYPMREPYAPHRPTAPINKKKPMKKDRKTHDNLIFPTCSCFHLHFNSILLHFNSILIAFCYILIALIHYEDAKREHHKRHFQHQQQQQLAASVNTTTIAHNPVHPHPTPWSLNRLVLNSLFKSFGVFWGESLVGFSSKIFPK